MGINADEQACNQPVSHYSKAELRDAKDAIVSSVHKIEKALNTLSQKDPPPKPQITLARRNIKALRIALALIERSIGE